jgi:hypothetical protein
MPTDEETFNIDMEQLQDRMDMEHDFEINLQSIIDEIISNANISLLPTKFKVEIDAYHELNNVPISFKFILVYRILSEYSSQPKGWTVLN